MRWEQRVWHLRFCAMVRVSEWYLHSELERGRDGLIVVQDQK